MCNSAEVYEQFVLEEDILSKRIYTCDEIIATMLYLLYKNSRDLHRDIVEKVLMSIHEIKSDLQTEQLHIRIEKTLTASALEEPDRLEQSAEAD